MCIVLSGHISSLIWIKWWSWNDHRWVASRTRIWIQMNLQPSIFTSHMFPKKEIYNRVFINFDIQYGAPSKKRLRFSTPVIKGFTCVDGQTNVPTDKLRKLATEQKAVTHSKVVGFLLVLYTQRCIQLKSSNEEGWPSEAKDVDNEEI